MSWTVSPLRLVGQIVGPYQLKIGNRVIKEYGNERDATHYQRGFTDGMRYMEQQIEPIVRKLEDFGIYESASGKKLNRYAREIRELMGNTPPERQEEDDPMDLDSLGPSPFIKVAG